MKKDIWFGTAGVRLRNTGVKRGSHTNRFLWEVGEAVGNRAGVRKWPGFATTLGNVLAY